MYTCKCVQMHVVLERGGFVFRKTYCLYPKQEMALILCFTQVSLPHLREVGRMEKTRSLVTTPPPLLVYQPILQRNNQSSHCKMRSRIGLRDLWNDQLGVTGKRGEQKYATQQQLGERHSLTSMCYSLVAVNVGGTLLGHARICHAGVSSQVLSSLLGPVLALVLQPVQGMEYIQKRACLRCPPFHLIQISEWLYVLEYFSPMEVLYFDGQILTALYLEENGIGFILERYLLLRFETLKQKLPFLSYVKD